MPLALSSCFCCFPKLLNHSLRERLVTHASSAGGTGADAAAEQQQQPAAAGAGMQSSASLQRLLAHGISSSCPNLHLLEENAALQQQQAAHQGSKSVYSKPFVRPPGSPQIERSSSQEAPSAAAKAKQKQHAGQQVQIELKPAESNPFLGVDHITADRSFVKARPGA